MQHDILFVSISFAEQGACQYIRHAPQSRQTHLRGRLDARAAERGRDGGPRGDGEFVLVGQGREGRGILHSFGSFGGSLLFGLGSLGSFGGENLFDFL